MERRRRTDQLPPAALLPREPRERARAAMEFLGSLGFPSLAMAHVAHGTGHTVIEQQAGRASSRLDIAHGLARQVARERRAYVMTRDQSSRDAATIAAISLGDTSTGTLSLVVADPRLSRRDAQALAAWACPPPASRDAAMHAHGGNCTDLIARLIDECGGDVGMLALFAPSGIALTVHVRSGALLHAGRVPTDTIWGEVARHGAAFTIGELPMHPGAQILASLGMRSAALAGIENGRGIAVGAVGVATATELPLDVAHGLLERVPQLGPEIMQRLSSTRVPQTSSDRTIDLSEFAQRVGCRRCAMYRVSGSRLEFVSAHDAAGATARDGADEFEEQLVAIAAHRGVGVVSDDAAAVLLGDTQVLYASDPRRSALERLRLALQDVKKSPFAAASPDDESTADAA